MNPEQVHILSRTTASLAADQNPVFSELPRVSMSGKQKSAGTCTHIQTHAALPVESVIANPICDRLD